MPNFSSLAHLEVPEKFMVGGVVWDVFQVATMSNLTKLLLSCFELRAHFYIFAISGGSRMGKHTELKSNQTFNFFAPPPLMYTCIVHWTVQLII